MIILDTCVIRGLRLDGSDAEVLRAIKATSTERIAASWMAMEELVAQKALDYLEYHRGAARALRQLKNRSHRAVPTVGDPDPEGVREMWRARYAALVEVLPTSENALRQGVYREANVLPPATTKGEDGKSVKVGARDVAVWLTAVEYAREHPEETVYFVSENHRDFTKGTGGYRWPMDEDVAGLGDRFVHLTNVGELLETVAPPVAVAPDTAHDVLVKSSDFIIEAGLSSWASGEAPFNVRLQDASVAFGRYWAPYEDPAAHLLEVRDIQGFRLGDQEWCLAVTRWQFAGTAFVSMFTTQSGAFPNPVLQLAACEWEATVLVPLNAGDEHAPRVMKSGPVKLAGDPSEVDWPMPPTGLEYARYLAEQAEREGRKVSWPEVFLASMIAFPSVRERVDLTQYMPAQPRGASRSELEL